MELKIDLPEWTYWNYCDLYLDFLIGQSCHWFSSHHSFAIRIGFDFEV